MTISKMYGTAVKFSPLTGRLRVIRENENER